MSHLVRLKNIFPSLTAGFYFLFSPHNGKDFTSFQLLKAMVLVYNLSYPLAFLLTSAYFTYGKLSFVSYNGLEIGSSNQDNQVRRSWPTGLFSRFISCARSLAACIFRHPSWTLDLQSLCQRGSLSIAHDGSFVHPDGFPSTSPDPSRVASLLQRASMARDANGVLKGGLGFNDIVSIRTENALSVHPMLNRYHEQISFGECGLLWEVFRERLEEPRGQPVTLLGEVIPSCRLQQWLGDEKLPDGWWDHIRPKKPVGLLQVRKTANECARLSKQMVKDAHIRKPSIHIHDVIPMDG